MQAQNYSIKQWSKDERPREKLLARGPVALSHSELIAILIINGFKEKTAVDLAREVLKSALDNLNELGKMSVRDLMKTKGIGLAKAIGIVAALELGRMRQAAVFREKAIITSSSDVALKLQALLR